MDSGILPSAMKSFFTNGIGQWYTLSQLNQRDHLTKEECYN